MNYENNSINIGLNIVNQIQDETVSADPDRNIGHCRSVGEGQELCYDIGVGPACRTTSGPINPQD
jgi:hypothetical protein